MQDGIPEDLVHEFVGNEMELADGDSDGLLSVQEFFLYLFSELYCLVPVWGAPENETRVSCADHPIRPADPPGLINGKRVLKTRWAESLSSRCCCGRLAGRLSPRNARMVHAPQHFAMRWTAKTRCVQLFE